MMPETLHSALLFYPVIFFIGLITTYQDFRYHKIKNKWVVLGLLYAICIYLLSLILIFLAKKNMIFLVPNSFVYQLIKNLDKWCVNLCVSIVVSIGLWYTKAWAPGDAKLFIAYSALIPLKLYSKVYFNYYFASFYLLLAIFVPAAVFLLTKELFYFLSKYRLKSFLRILELTKDFISKKKEGSIKVLFGMTFFFLFFRLVNENAYNFFGKFIPDQNFLILISFFAFPWLSKIFRKSINLMGFLATILISFAFLKNHILITNPFNFIINSVSRAVLVILLFSITRIVLYFYPDRTEGQTLPFAPWIFLGTLLVLIV